MIALSNLIGANLLALTASGAPMAQASSAGPSPVEMWAGHQITFGSRKIPFRGRVQTRTDNYVLARVDRRGEELVLTQKACRVEFKPVGGVQVRMDAQALPADRFTFEPKGRDELVGRSSVSWGAEDIDRDGNPGMTVVVDSSVCSGDLYVSNDSRTSARAVLARNGLRGLANVRVRQEILGTEGMCLGMVAKDTDERVRGPFAYVEVEPDATCESLLRGGWPIDAED